MPQQTINIGAAPDDGTGDTLRVGGDKINDNFTELYTDKLDKAGGTLTGDLVVPDEAYDATAWNGSLEVPTKNAVRDKIESLGSGITELDDIPDVNATTPANGDVLTWDSTPGEWVAQAPAGAGAFDLDDATDVNAPTPSNGDVLTWDSTPGEWVAQAPAASGGMTLIESLTPSAVASINSEAWAGGSYKALKFIYRLTASTDQVTLTARYKLNGSYKTAANYRWGSSGPSSSGSAVTTGAQTGTAITLGHSGANGVGNDTLEHVAGEITIYRPFETTKPKVMQANTTVAASNGSYQFFQGGGTYDGTDYASALAGLQFLVSAGTFTGTIDVFGIS